MVEEALTVSTAPQNLGQAQQAFSPAEGVIFAARAYRAQELLERPRMWRGRKLKSLADQLDVALADYDSLFDMLD